MEVKKVGWKVGGARAVCMHADRRTGRQVGRRVWDIHSLGWLVSVLVVFGETIGVVLCFYCWYLVLCSEESVPSKLLGLLHLCLLPLLCIEE